MFISRSGVRQPVTLPSEKPVKRSGAAPAKSENTRVLHNRELKVSHEDGAKVHNSLKRGPAANDGNKSLELAETDPLQGINPADPDGVFRDLCIKDDGKKLSYRCLSAQCLSIRMQSQEQTGMSSLDLRFRAVESGVRTFIFKPF